MLNKDMLAIQNRIGKVQKPSIQSHQKSNTNVSKPFGEYLDKQIKGGLKFSKHASERLSSRSIRFSSSEISKIEESLIEADKKGMKDSLVLVGQVALVVNVTNKTVVTAVKQQEQQLFTNIDGAIII